jgi:hypothetical protein
MSTVLMVIGVWLLLSLPATFLVCVLCRGRHVTTSRCSADRSLS